MGAAPLNPPPPRSSSRWIFWVLGGCLLVVVVVVGGIVGVFYWGKSKLTTYVEEQTDPAKREQRLKEMLGAQTLPPGYHAGVSISLGLARTAWLSDRPVAGEEAQYGERGFVFNEARRAGEAKAKVEQFATGEGGNVIDEMGVRMRSDETLGDGTVDVNGQRLRWYARRGEVTHSKEAVAGVYSVILIDCGDSRERWAVWFQRVPPGTPTNELPRAGSVIDENAIRTFFSHFRLCR